MTLTECAALSAVVAPALSVFVYRGIRPSQVLTVMAEAVRNATAIMIIIALALIFGHWVTEAGVATRVVNWATGLGLEWWQFLIGINLLLLFLGMFLAVFSVLLLTMPVLLPLPEPFTIAPAHVGVVAVMTMEFALLTPPVGPNFFDRAGILRCPLSEVVRGLRPFIVIMALLLILATDVPVIATFLPDLV